MRHLRDKNTENETLHCSAPWPIGPTHSEPVRFDLGRLLSQLAALLLLTDQPNPTVHQ